jgi:FkbH-like protein
MLDPATTNLAHALSDLRTRIAAARLDLPEIFSLGDRIAELAANASDGAELVQRVAILGALNTDYIRRAIAVAVVQEGALPVIYQAPYGSYVQEVLDPSAGMHAFRPNVVVLAPDWRDVVDDLPIGASAGAVAEAVGRKIDLFCHLWNRIGVSGSRIVQHLLVPPARAWGGVAERLAPASPANQVRAINDGLVREGRGRIHWVDMERLAGEVGTRAFAPDRFYHNGRLGMENRHLPRFLTAFRAAWRLSFGRGKKVLALDLDNTLWGGVIGDDGVDGICLGPGSPVGEAFAEWQHYVRALRSRGVILAVCSKNDPTVATTGFMHMGSVLKREDFAAFECSWQDKVQGLRAIARNLNVGIDSLVFCDDNPAECDLVRRELPEVEVIELGDDPTRFIDKLDSGHSMDLAEYTSEDLGRADMYTARGRALEEANSAPDIGAYLRGLNMQGCVWRPEEPDLPRVAQLEMKTNQFNLTTRRLTEAQLREFLAREDALVLAFRLRDRFGDHGLTSTLIAVHEGDALRIVSWLMSCRIFSRTAEQFIMRFLLTIAAEKGFQTIIGDYTPTARNGVVADLYPRLGFKTLENRNSFELIVGAPDFEGLSTSIAAV